MTRSIRTAGLAVLVGMLLTVGAGIPSAGAVAGHEPSASDVDQFEATDDLAPAVPAASDEPVVDEAADGVEGSDLSVQEAEDLVEPTDHAAPSGVTPDTAAPAFPFGFGATVPGGKNESTADLLGLGYEQVIRLSGSRVEIVEPLSRGSRVLRSFEAGASRDWPKNEDIPLFYGGENLAKKVVGHSASRLAVAGGHIYVSNVKTKPSGVSKARVPDGSVVRRFTVDGLVTNSRTYPEAFAVTALDAFVWGGKEYVAMGLNYSGIRVGLGTVQGMPDHRVFLEHWGGPKRKGGEWVQRDQMIELRFGVDELGRFLLVAGAVTQEMPALVTLNVDAGTEVWTHNFRPHQSPWEWPEVIEFLPLPGRVQIAVGWPTLGQLHLMEVSTSNQRGIIPGGVVSVVRYFQNAAGEPRVGFRSGVGHVFTSMVAKIDAGGNLAGTMSGGAQDLEWMVPGYRAWSVQVENRSRAELRFQPFAGATRAQGCWLVGGMKGVTSPLPTQPVQVPAGGRSAQYVTAHKRWGDAGDACRAEDPGLFYLQLDPVSEPGHRQVVQLASEPAGLRIAEQVGKGRFAIQLEPDGPLGVKLVVTDRFAAPSIVGVPRIDATRLTPRPVDGHQPTNDVNDPSRPVHRFTVSGVTWKVPGAEADQAEATLPLPVAEASVDGVEWHRLGTVASPVAPTRTGDRVTMGPALFDWQTVVGAPKDFRFFRVTAGGAVSEAVDVTPLDAPTPTSVVTKLQMAATGSPRANGLDQVAARVSMLGESSRGLDPKEHQDWYQRIYYRDATTKALVTGLGDAANPNQLLAFSLQPGQYANEGIGAERSGSIGVYFSLRSSQQGRSVTAVFKSDGTTRSAFTSAPSLAIVPESSPLLPGGSGVAGLTVSPCAEGACTLANPESAPALHSLTATSVSVQLSTGAIPGASSLPLVRLDDGADRPRLHTDVLRFGPGRATLANPNSFGSIASFTTHLVTHGERITFESRDVR